MKYVIIGDIHGQHLVLKKLLEELGIYRHGGQWYSQNNYIPIFLGDINDYKENSERKSSIKSLIMVREIVCDLKAIVLYSNHLDKLKRWLQGNKVKVNNGLENTSAEFESLFNYFNDDTMTKVFKENWIDWIDRLSKYYYFEEEDKTYVCAHAYFDDKLWNMVNYDPHWDEKPKDRDWFKTQCIYGRLNREGERREWWLEEEYAKEHFKDNYYIFGHSHIEVDGFNFSIIDNETELVAFIPSENRKVRVRKI